jgi:chemotaxis protein CheD
VKVADFAAAKGDAIITTVGLGSCVAIILHDATSGVGGLAHVLLPQESLSRDTRNRAKFATTAVPLLVDELRRLGSRGAVSAKLVGGASMFAQLLPNSGINMGERNVDSARRALTAARLQLVGADTGGDFGRTVHFHVASGKVIVRSLKGGDRVL